MKKGIDGFIIAECLEIPGCMSQRKTIEETKANIKDVISTCISVIFEDYLYKQHKHLRAKEPQLGLLKKINLK